VQDILVLVVELDGLLEAVAAVDLVMVKQIQM
jgi:hypothetical protein